MPIASEETRRQRIRQGVAADQARMRYYSHGRRVGSPFAGTKSEQVAVQSQARGQSKKNFAFGSMSSAAKNAVDKNMHKKKPSKKPRGVNEDVMHMRDRQGQEDEYGVRRKGY